MKKAAAHPTTSNAHGKTHLDAGTIMLDLLDTTWRIATPVVIFAGLGIFADLQLESKPWCTLAGTVVGFVFAGLLLKQQLVRAEREDTK